MDYKRFTVEEFVLDKYFRQWVLNPNAESNLFWQMWLQRNPKKREVLQEAKAIILIMPRIDYGWDIEVEDALWQSIQQNTQEINPDKAAPVEAASEEEYLAKVIPLHSAAVLGSPGYQPQHKQWNYQAMGRVAATILLVMTVGIAGYLGFNGQPQIEPQPVAYLTKEAPLGTKTKFSLPDGSQIILNSGSSVHYPEVFNDSERLIEIKGEAFLEVAKDRTKPFRVKTGTVMTEALGTAFNIIYEQEAVEVALVEGKVKVTKYKAGKKEEKVILMPGEQASLQDEKYLTKDVFDLEKVTAWKEGIVFFEGAGEDEFINSLERWYGVEISVKGKASKVWNFSGRFKGKSLEYILKSVGYTMDFNFTIEKKKVKIIYN